MSSKKLHDILNPSYTPLKDNDKLTSSNHKSPFQRPNNLLPTNPSPSAEFPHTPPLYMNLPKNQNIFYDPMLITRHEAICSSPMFHESQNTIIKGYLPRSLMGSYLSSETSEENTQNNKNKYNQASPYFHSNFHELHIGSTIQPKNLKELIQRSFSTVPSNSPFQASFHSVMPSPFLSHGTPNSHFCPSTALKASNQCSSGILGTPLQNPCVLQEKNLNSYQQNQSTLICKLAKISGKENEKTIETAENQIIPKLQAFEIMTAGIIYKEADKSPCPKHSPQDYYKNQILKMLSSPNVQDLQYNKSPNYHGEFSGQLTESQFQRLNNGMLQDSCSELKNSSFGQQRREDRGVNNTKIKSWTKKPVTNRISKNRGKTFGKRPRIKGRFITLEEYMVYRKGRSDDENNDMRSSWSNPLFGENL